MKISEILARDAEDAWIAKYRSAMEASTTEPQGKLKLGEMFIRVCKNLTSGVRRILVRWRRPQQRNLPANVEVMNSAAMRSAPALGKTTGVLSNNTEPSQLAS